MKTTRIGLVLFLCLCMGFSVLANGQKEKQANDEGLTPYVITWYQVCLDPNQTDLSLVEDAINEYLTEKINATVDIKLNTFGEHQDKMQTIIASGVPFDVAFTASWTGFKEQASRGAYVELSDLLKQYGQGILEIIPETFWQGINMSGDIYAVPTNKELAHQWVYLLNNDLVKKYGFKPDNVHSYGDIEEMLATIHAQEPGIIPLSLTRLDTPLLSLPFDKLAGDNCPVVLYTDNSSDFKVVNMLDTPEIREYFRTMHRWYKNGYLRNDVAMVESVVDVSKAHRFFAEVSSVYPYSTYDKEAAYGMSRGQLVQAPMMQPIVMNRDCGGSMQAISSTSKDPARAMMFLELLNTDPYLRNLVTYGIEGKHYNKISDNYIRFPEGKSAATVGWTLDPWAVGNMFLLYLTEGTPADKWVKFSEFNASASAAPSLGFSFDPQPVRAEIAAIANVWEEYLPALQTGSVDPEVYLPRALDAFRNAGIDKVMKEAQAQLDAWVAAN